MRVEIFKGIFLLVENLYIAIPFIVISFITLIIIVLWYKFGRDEKTVETVEFYPPDGLNSVEMAYIYKGRVNDKDVVSLLIYLANKGYFEIVEEGKIIFDEKTSRFINSSEKEFRIEKLKEYDGDNEIERQFFRGLFGEEVRAFTDNPKELKGVHKGKRDSVYEENLADSFYEIISEIKITTKKLKKKIFDKKASISKNASIIMFMGVLLYIIKLISHKIGIELCVILIIWTIMFLMLLIFCISTFILTFAKKDTFKRITRLIIFFFFALPNFVGFIIFTYIFIVYFIPQYIIATNNKVNNIIIIFGIICLTIMAIFIVIMDKRTKYGADTVARIKGFKKNLECAEKGKLEALIMENPTYFYDILPYTYVLGVSNKWIDKFETITYGAPRWYKGENIFEKGKFGSFLNEKIKSAKSTIKSSLNVRDSSHHD